MRVLWLIPISGAVAALARLVMELEDWLEIPGWWSLCWNEVRWRYVESAAMLGVLVGTYLAALSLLM